MGTSSQARSVLIQDDGKVLVAGSTFDGSQWDFTVVRYNSDGTFDTSFGSGGTVITDLAGGDDTAYALALDSDGIRIYRRRIHLATVILGTDIAHRALHECRHAGTTDRRQRSTLNGTPSYDENGSPVRLDTRCGRQRRCAATQHHQRQRQLRRCITDTGTQWWHQRGRRARLRGRQRYQPRTACDGSAENRPGQHQLRWGH
ncbi:MAG: delta-60 repeat domain-containing protein [Pseudomonadales bacterium]